MKQIDTSNITLEDIKKADTSDLLALYNEITGEEVKKFADRATAERRTWKVVGQLAPGENIWNGEKKPKEKKVAEPKAKKAAAEPKPKKAKVVKEKSKRVMRFCFAPQKTITTLRPTSKRAKVLELLSRKRGALFSEIKEAFPEWTAKDVYEAIRLVHFTNGIGMWSYPESDDLRIMVVRTMEEYKSLLEEEKKAA